MPYFAIMKQIKLCEGEICSFESINFPTAHRWPSFFTRLFTARTRRTTQKNNWMLGRSERLIYRRGISLFGLTRRSAGSAYRLTKRRTAARPPSISLRLPCPEHLNLRFVRILVNAFRLHDELLTPVKRKRPLIFLVDTQRQARFARLRIL